MAVVHATALDEAVAQEQVYVGSEVFREECRTLAAQFSSVAHARL